jgi:PAS domain S-box-containing protein
MPSEGTQGLRDLLRKIENSGEAFRAILEAFPDFILILDFEGRILGVNRGFMQASGLKCEEVVGISAISFVHSEDTEKALKILKEAFESDKIVRGEIRAKIGANEFVLDVSCRCINYDGMRLGIFVAKDVTEKVGLERKTAETEMFHKNIIDCSISGFLMLQRERIVFANRTVEKITGYSVDELLGKSIEIFFEPRLTKSVRETVEKVLRNESVELVTSFLRKDGEKRYAKVFANLIDGGKDLILVSFEDITDKREYERKLEERELLYRTLVENSHTGIFIIQNNKIIYANDVVSKMLGYTIEDIRKFSHPYDIVSPEFREMAKRRYLARERGLKVPDSYELKVQTKDWKEKWVKVLAKRIKYKGKPAVIVNIADVTNLKENEEKLSRMNALLRVSGEISGMLIQENSEFRILSHIRFSLEKLQARVGVFLFESEFVPFSVPSELLALDLSGKEGIRDVVQEYRSGKFYTFIPAFAEKLVALVVVERDDNFTEDELRVISTISQNLSMRLKALKVEREKDLAHRIIVENIKQFEELADKFRNPLAVIKGYLEIRDEIPEGEFVKKLSEHVEKMERILDELRTREMATYKLKKILESGKI